MRGKYLRRIGGLILVLLVLPGVAALSSTTAQGDGSENRRDRIRDDPWRSHFFGSGANGYNSRFGRRDVYQQAYRDGFLRGYQEGYQNWQRYFTGGIFHR